MRMADSTAFSLTTGSEPGRPRQTGHTWVFGSAPNSVGQPQNILVAVESSTWTSMPSTGSYRATTSAYSISSTVGALMQDSLGKPARTPVTTSWAARPAHFGGTRPASQSVTKASTCGSTVVSMVAYSSRLPVFAGCIR